MLPRVDVVMVSWNDKANVTTALDSVFALSEVQADPNFVNVVVSDNGSTDGTVELIRERYGARVTVIENGANLAINWKRAEIELDGNSQSRNGLGRKIGRGEFFPPEGSGVGHVAAGDDRKQERDIFDVPRQNAMNV